MGGKRWGEASLELLLLCFLPRLVLGDGEVGCLFSKNVCRPGVETCYDDWAFGKCVQAFGELDSGDTHRYDLESEELDSLRQELQRLVLGGYTWAHPYTQCVIQSSLYALRFRLRRNHEICQKLADSEDRNFKEYNQPEEPVGEPQPLAVVNFTPIRGHGYGVFANEKYYPPPLSSSSNIKNDENRQVRRTKSLKDYAYGLSSVPVQEAMLYSKPSDPKSLFVNAEKAEETVFAKANSPQIIDEDTRDYREPSRRLLTARHEKPTYNRLRRQPSSMKIRDNDNKRASFFLDKNLWKLAVANDTGVRREEDAARIEFLADRSTNENYRKDNDNEDGDQEAISRLEASLERLNNHRKSDSYGDSLVIQPLVLNEVLDPESEVADFEDDLNALLWTRNLAAFQRPERVDVKKPGPLYSTNNYAFKTQSPSAPMSIDDETDKPKSGDREEGGQDEIFRAPLVKKGTTNVMYNGKTYANVNLDHVYIQFGDEFKKWSEGKKIVQEIGKLLEMSSDSFTDIRVGRAEVTFKVVSDSPNEAIDVARKIKLIREELQKATGKEIIRAGIGDKVKLPPTVEVEVTRKPMSSGLFGAIVAAGGAAAAAAAVVTLVIARKHAKSRAKLAGLATPDPEASKDYQDLCRARMQAKQSSDKPESPRIVGLSRESESQRSSTSSWGEEAAALTNMDIATGHMVLSYMEDHLKNKDRLDQEWAGICAYEADPASVANATDKLNGDRNRPGSALPYDHSRVVLNDLSNANNSDYINASTITDHDPRNPAYIACQGPLPQTSSDFWQLVWEQGSVVIVMLTRLTEEGRAMCHRYWPEEGSELYHIYEVHLVSEHIWCDDYLVRSFYLKNLRTGETRTVTQFHFLSWPERDVPQSTKALLEFRRKVNKSYRGRSCPIVVHCSDGAGRTGTYCLIDMVLNRMAKGAKEIDIAATLEHIRDQRPGMVATKQQFEFVLVAVAEEVHAILKALPMQTATEKTAPPSNVASPSATQASSSANE